METTIVYWGLGFRGLKADIGRMEKKIGTTIVY